MAKSLIFLQFVLIPILGVSCAHSTVKLDPNKPLVTTLNPDSNLTLEIRPESQSGTAFWVLEAHTQNVSLQLRSHLGDHKVNSQSNLGIVLKNDGVQNKTRRVLLVNPNPQNVSAVLLLRSYSSMSPVPGICNKNNATTINYRPALVLEWNSDVINVNFTNAGVLNTPSYSCTDEGQTKLEYSVYMRYLQHQNFNEDYYLSELTELMLLKDDIEQHGTLISEDFIKIPDLEGIQSFKAAAYPGTTVIFSVIVSHGNESSVYVSTATYGCDWDPDSPQNCEVLYYTSTMVVCAAFLCMGLFLAFLGHRHFPWSQFVFGLIVGSVIGYILIMKYSNLSYQWVLGMTIFVAFSGGIGWMCQWIMLGIPIVAMIIPTLVLGFLLSCFIFFFPALNTPTFFSDEAYWLTVSAITVAVPLILISFAKTASILSCVLVGSFAFIVPIDHYIGTSLKFVFVNVLRRATLPDFQIVFLTPPFQAKDIALAVGLLGVALVSLLFQHLRERNRAPFPPNYYLIWRWRREEGDESSVPLLNDYDPSNQHVFNQEFYDEIRDAARRAILEAAEELNASGRDRELPSALAVSSSRRPETEEENLHGSFNSTARVLLSGGYSYSPEEDRRQKEQQTNVRSSFRREDIFNPSRTPEGEPV